MQFSVPHQLGKDEVRRRMQRLPDEIRRNLPGGMAQVTSDWPSEDRMDLAIGAMGQHLSGHLEIGDAQVLYVFDLPPSLGFIEPMVRGAVEKVGRKLLS